MFIKAIDPDIFTNGRQPGKTSRKERRSSLQLLPEASEVDLALDTNRYTDLANGKADVVAILNAANAVYVPFVTIAELRGGFAMGTRGKKNEEVLARFLSKSKVRPLYPDHGTTLQYARVYAQLRRQGTPIPTNDMWIAALVLQHDLTLYARDAHFDHLPQLKRA
jgi:tRNA(fMet)-specific endonuclease VapC